MLTCTQDIMEAMRQAGFEIDEDEAADILDAMVDDIEKQQGKIYSQAQEDALRERRLNLHQQAKISAAIQKRNFLINKGS